MSVDAKRFGLEQWPTEILWLAGRIVRKIAYVVLPVRFHFAIAELRCRLARSVTRPQDNARRNIQSVFGSSYEAPEVDRIVRDYLRFTETSHLWKYLMKRPSFRVPKRWPVQGIERLRSATDEGRGVILVSAHLGEADLIPWILELHGYKVRRVTAELPRSAKRQVEDWLAQSGRLKRYIYESTRVYVEPGYPDDLLARLDARPVLAAIADGQTLLIPGDGFRATAFVRLQLLGQTYPFPSGFMKIALMTGAVVLPTFAIPDMKNRTVRVEIGAPLSLDPSKSIEENIKYYADVLDEQLVRTPHLWIRWGRANWFEEANKWVDEEREDPFTSTPAWMRGN